MEESLLSSFFRLVRRWFAAKAAGSPAEPEGLDERLPDAVVVTDDLDLHGFFPEQVPELLDEFLRNARELGIREVRIAHGKGQSVLRRIVWECLASHPLVVDYRQAPPDRGGWGATLARIVPRD
jgi:DNA-nicking Smr family endonuclease